MHQPPAEGSEFFIYVGACALDARVYVMGGRDDNKDPDNVQSACSYLEVQANKWKKMQEMTYPRESPCKFTDSS